jgi:hypothetical protein
VRIDFLPRPFLFSSSDLTADEILGIVGGMSKSDSFQDSFGNTWKLPASEVCQKCGQPDNCGDCNHQPLSPEEVRELGGIPA